MQMTWPHHCQRFGLAFRLSLKESLLVSIKSYNLPLWLWVDPTWDGSTSFVLNYILALSIFHSKKDWHDFFSLWFSFFRTISNCRSVIFILFLPTYFLRLPRPNIYIYFFSSSSRHRPPAHFLLKMFDVSSFGLAHNFLSVFLSMYTFI